MIYDKEEVNYRKAPSRSESCRECIYFIPGDHRDKPGKCEKVIGMIRPDDTSDMFEPR